MKHEKEKTRRDGRVRPFHNSSFIILFLRQEELGPGAAADSLEDLGIGGDELADTRGRLVDGGGDLFGVDAVDAGGGHDLEDLGLKFVVGDGRPANPCRARSRHGLEFAGRGTACDFRELAFEIGDDLARRGKLLSYFVLGLFPQRFEAALQFFNFLLCGYGWHEVSL